MTNHSWQSMKYRYRTRLAKKQPGAEEVGKTGGSETAGERTEVCDYPTLLLTWSCSFGCCRAKSDHWVAPVD